MNHAPMGGSMDCLRAWFPEIDFMDSSRSENTLSPAFSAKAQRTHASPISSLIAAAIANPNLINFAAGLVDPLTLPIEECLSITRKILSDRPRAQLALQYDTTLGLAPLRQALLSHLERLEGKNASQMRLGADDVIISTGSQQMLYLIGEVLLDVGDIVIAANPSYFVFTGALESFDARVMAVPMDEQGMDVEAVDALLHELREKGELGRVKFIYCTSYFDNPSGRTLSLARRRKLLEIVQRHSQSHRILILEDAAYRELRYDGEDVRSIKSFDERNQYVILTQTFSKPFSPGIKVGYTFLPSDLVGPVLHQKGNHDFGSANLCQQIALEAMTDGSYHSHLEVLKREYRKKRDTLLKALERHLRRCSWTHPHGGLYVWLSLPKSIDTRREGPLFKACMKNGVLYVPGDYCFTPDREGRIPTNHLRLSFGQVHPDQIEEGVRRLAASIEESATQEKAA